MNDLIPPATACCPRCAGTIAMLDTIEDTLETQVRSWVCLDCCATGWIGLTIRLTEHRDQLPPRQIIERHTINHDAMRRIA